MAFTTVTGASGAPTTYTGTDGVDLITLVNPGASDLQAEAADDFIGINLTGTTTATSQTLRGGQGNDTFAYTGNANALISSYLAGNLGDDTFAATGAGFTATASTLQGGQGNDTINVGATNGGSLINGNLGDDTIAATQAVTISSTSIFGGQGNDTITVGGGATTLQGVSIDGAIGNDVITINALGAASTSVTVNGGAGNDVVNATNAAQALIINGGEGNDNLIGGAGNDTMTGDTGNDQINGLDGINTLTGGSGADTFAYTSATGYTNITNYNVITDFNTGAASDDVIGIDVSAWNGGIIANNTGVVTNVLGSDDNLVIVDQANTGYISFAAAEAAVQGANSATLDYVLIFRNTTSGLIEMWADADSSGVGNGAMLARFSNFTSAAQQAAALAAATGFNTADFNVLL